MLQDLTAPLTAVIGLLIILVAFRCARRGVLHVCCDHFITWLNTRSPAPVSSCASSLPSQRLAKATEAVVHLKDVPYYPLAKAYPALGAKLEILPLCKYPTPIRRWPRLLPHRRGRYTPETHSNEHGYARDAESAETGGARESTSSSVPELYVKDDGCTCPDGVYGGNKPRKLEWLLAKALRGGSRELFTCGTAGSHSVLGTISHAGAIGLRCVAHITPQLPAPRVAKNLVHMSRVLRSEDKKKTELKLEKNGRVDGDDDDDTIGDSSGNASKTAAVRSKPSVLRYYRSIIRMVCGTAWHLMRRKIATGCLPFVVPPGATSALSTIGYVNAAYELADDIKCGRLPGVPSRVYVPAGSGGTYIGFLIGIKAIDIFKQKGTRVVAVRSGTFRPVAQALALFNEVVAVLRSSTGGAFPLVRTSEKELLKVVDTTMFGKGYGHPTVASEETIRLVHGRERDSGIHIESTYTAKTVACMLRDANEMAMVDTICMDTGAGTQSNSETKVAASIAKSITHGSADSHCDSDSDNELDGPGPEVWLYWHTNCSHDGGAGIDPPSPSSSSSESMAEASEEGEQESTQARVLDKERKEGIWRPSIEDMECVRTFLSERSIEKYF